MNYLYITIAILISTLACGQTARVTTTTTTPVPVMSSTTSLTACPNVNGMANINTNKVIVLIFKN